MKRLILLLTVFLLATVTYSQSKIYDPSANAEKQIKEAVKDAQAKEKHVFVMIGGNWCPWCRKLHKFLSTQEEVNKILEKNYVMVKVNYSKENKNKEVLADLGYPHRFGFPVLVILDENGERLHTQSTVFLEEGKGYSKKTIKEFLNNWSPKALNPASYN